MFSGVCYSAYVVDVSGVICEVACHVAMCLMGISLGDNKENGAHIVHQEEPEVERDHAPEQYVEEEVYDLTGEGTYMSNTATGTMVHYVTLVKWMVINFKQAMKTSFMILWTPMTTSILIIRLKIGPIILMQVVQRRGTHILIRCHIQRNMFLLLLSKRGCSSMM